MKEWSISQPGVLPGQGETPRLQDLPQTGRAVDATAAGVRVELAGTQSGVLYGPARWNLGSYPSPTAAILAGHYPHPDDTVLIVFAGVGIEDPWVVAWWR
jgi:hypothetical protein